MQNTHMHDADDVQPVEDITISTEEPINVTLPVAVDTPMPTVHEEAVSIQPKAKQRGGRQKKSDV